jgi:hypothetical protein
VNRADGGSPSAMPAEYSGITLLRNPKFLAAVLPESSKPSRAFNWRQLVLAIEVPRPGPNNLLRSGPVFRLVEIHAQPVIRETHTPRYVGQVIRVNTDPQFPGRYCSFDSSNVN